MLYDFHPEFTSMADHLATDTATNLTMVRQDLVTANTYPAYSQVIASTTYDSYGLIIRSISAENSTRQLYRTMGQLATGAAGSEVNIIEGINFGQVSAGVESNGAANSMFFPVFIPAGTRLSYRGKCSLNNAARVWLSVSTIRQNSYPFNRWIGTRVTTYGIDDANLTSLVTTTPGAGNDTWGAWTTITASTTRHHKALLFNMWARQNQVTEYMGYTAQFAVGAAGSENIIGFIRMTCPPEHLYQHYLRPTEDTVVYIDIPAGSRISARVMASSSLEQRIIGVSFYGIS